MEIEIKNMSLEEKEKKLRELLSPRDDFIKVLVKNFFASDLSRLDSDPEWKEILIKTLKEYA